MSLLMDDQTVAAKILEHIANKTTDAADEVWREPVANYTCARRLQLEIKHIMQRWPTVFCPTSALPDRGSYVAREAAGTPLVAVRGEDDEIRVFRNACRHRGTQVAEGSGKTRVFVCAYHGWAYQLDGRLSHVPHEEGFPDLDKSCHGLVPVEAREQDGLVYVVQDPAPGCWDVLADIPLIIESDQQVFTAGDYTVQANWKIFAEGFLEGYHIKPAHKDTFYPYGYDNLNIVETYGRNGRITFPFQRIEKLADVAPAERRVDGRLTYVHHLFPNVMIAILSHFTSVVVLEPDGLGCTRTFAWTLTNRGKLDSDKAVEDAKRDAHFVNNTGQQEDRDLVEAIQRGIASKANDCFTFGRYEKLVSHFHRNLHECIGDTDIDADADSAAALGSNR